MIASRELAKRQEKYTMQDPDTASQELAKWQVTHATIDPETAKHENRKDETKKIVKLIARGKNKETDRQYLILGIKNAKAKASTMKL